MKLFNYILLCALFVGVSCLDNVPGMREPDKTIENVTGILHYSNEMGMWGIHYGYPGTIDRVDLYLIKETDEDFHFEEGEKVTVSGSCYLAEAPFPVPAGTTVYYIITTNLTYCNPEQEDESPCSSDIRSLTLSEGYNFPGWLSTLIKEIETLYAGDVSILKIRIFECEWQDRKIYYIYNNLSSCLYCEVYYTNGEKIKWSPQDNSTSFYDSFCSTSKNWKLIYEFGEIDWF
jgi:hypothetical protein